MPAVRVQFLGCGDAFASGGRLQTCIHLDGGPEPMLIDCGATALVGIRRAGIDPNQIGWIALTHLHGDHFGGIPWLVLDGQFGGRERDLVIGGPEGTRERLDSAFEVLYPGSSRRERVFETRVVEFADRGRCELGPAVVIPFPVVHQSGAPSYALRVQYGGKVIAYSGDTEWTEALLEVAAGADLFVCECNFFDEQAPGHLDYKTLGPRLKQFDCRRLVLTHLGADMLEHVADLGLEAAQDGAVIMI